MSAHLNVRLRQRPAPRLPAEDPEAADRTDASDSVATSPADKLSSVNLTPSAVANLEPGSPSPERPEAKSYEVGYKKPPREHQFKPGNNANPKGRPKGSKNLSTMLSEALSEKVAVRDKGKTRKMTKGEIGFARSVNKFAETGDPRFIAHFARLLPSQPPATRQDVPLTGVEDPSSVAMIAFLEEVVRSGGTFLSNDTLPEPDNGEEGK